MGLSGCELPYWLFFSNRLQQTYKMSGRQMKYPYTFSAKLALFPYRHHIQNHWVFKYYTFGLIASFPVFMWLSGKINSPGNIKKYEDQMAKEAAEAHGH